MKLEQLFQHNKKKYSVDGSTPGRVRDLDYFCAASDSVTPMIDDTLIIGQHVKPGIIQ